jgi:hypothetical protein
MRWRELKPGQQEILEDLLDQRPVKFLRPPLCASIKLSSIGRGLHTQARPSFGQASGQTSGHVSSAQQKYAPAGGGSLSSGNSVPGSQPGSSTNTMPSASGTPPDGHASTPSDSEQNKQLWVVFGVEGPRITLELDQIGNGDLQSDPVFLRKLRRRHYLLRGWLRSYFSFWRLSYWEFVKVSILKSSQGLSALTHNQFERILLQPGRIVVQKVDLPNSSEYEYSPRPPDVTVEHPGISRHEFEIIVRLCITPCLFTSFPILHDCISIEENATYIIGRLPKKKTEFQINVQEQRNECVWGIQARYVVSALRVVIIHVIILGVSFGVWIWWQRKHPDDLQGASVPLTVAGILVSTFWSSTGVLKGLRDHVPLT